MPPETLIFTEEEIKSFGKKHKTRLQDQVNRPSCPKTGKDQNV